MRRLQYLSFVLASVPMVTACGGDTENPPAADASPSDDASTPGAVSLEGLWEMSADLPEGSALTYEFAAAASGSASTLLFDSRSGITTCDEVDYALLADGTLKLNHNLMTVEATGPDEVILTTADGGQMLTLSRVVGEAPVEPCQEIAASAVGYTNWYLDQHSRLDTYDGKLYFTSDVPGQPIITYDIAEQQVVGARDYLSSYTVIGVIDDTVMFGSVHAGGSDTLDRFDLALGTHDEVTLTTEDGAHVFIQTGFYDRDAERLKIVVNTEDAENLLLTFNPTTMLVESQQPFLPGAYVVDLAMRDRDLIALLWNSTLVVVGDDGLATESIKVTGVRGFLRGIAVIGPTAYLLSEDGRGWIAAALLP